MARSMNPNKRGTRYWGPLSGTTFSTQPSGVTIGSAETTILATGKGASFSLTGASVPWAGTTLQISHGFTTLQGLGIVYVDAQNKSDVSPIITQLIQSAGGDTNSTVSAVAVIYSDTSNGTSTILQASGGTVFWYAFGK